MTAIEKPSLVLENQSNDTVHAAAGHRTTNPVARSLLPTQPKRVRRARHPALKGLDKTTVIEEVTIEEIHTLISTMTNPEDFGYDNGEGRRYWNHEHRRHSQHGAQSINYDRLLEWYVPKHWDWLYYTGNITGPTWVTIDIDEHKDQTDGAAHLASILEFLGVADAFTFRTRKGLQSVLRYEGGSDNRSDLEALRDAVQAKGKANNGAKLFASTVELKGCPARYETIITPHGIRAIIKTHGTLARIPKVTTATEIETLLRINLSTELLLTLVRLGRGKQRQDTKETTQKATPQQPASETFRGVVRPGRGKRRQATKAKGKRPAAGTHENATSPDARLRMIHAKCDYVREHKCLPLDAASLVAHYVLLGLNTGKEDQNGTRLSRASSVLAYAASQWVDGRGGRKALSFNQELFDARVAYLSSFFTKEQVAGAKKSKANRVGCSFEDMAAFEIVALALEVPDRDGIKETLNRWHKEGHLSHTFNNDKCAAVVFVLRELGVLVHTKHTRPSGTKKGVARRYRPGVHGLGFGEWSRLQKAEQDREREALEAEIPYLDDEGSEVMEPVFAPEDFASIEEELASYLRQKFLLERYYAEHIAECDLNPPHIPPSHKSRLSR